MKAEQFCFWLQGHFEMNPGIKALSEEQVEILKKHLAMVFVHDIDPKMGGPEKQKVLNEIHNLPSDPIFRC